MGKGGGGSSGGGESTVRYAPYIESAHSALINTSVAEGAAILHTSPYASFTISDPDDAFFGIGYVVGNFPALYDMFGKFMAGLDIEVLYTQEMTDTIYSGPIGDSVAAESAYLDDQINTVSLPRIEAGAYTLNAVMSSSFIAARLGIEEERTRSINKYQADLRMKAMDLGHDRWKTHLLWNQSVMDQYTKMNQLYFSSHFDYIKLSTELSASNKLWPFEVLDQERAIVGALNGAAAAQSHKVSKTQSALSGVFGGAAAGAAIGGPIGGIIGGVLGLFGGLFG